MQHNTETKIWNATLYLRLSRDDGDKEESNSITGQRELLRDFIRSRPELREYAVRIDDGFTGSNFERPSFKKMLEDVKAGRTNCIIVSGSDDNSNAVIEHFKSYAGITALTREISIGLLHSVTIYPDGRMDIRLNFADEIKALMEALRRESCTA